jgi:NADPH:quinone reductase-like Zn-dependent oxidoreductase
MSRRASSEAPRERSEAPRERRTRVSAAPGSSISPESCDAAPMRKVVIRRPGSYDRLGIELHPDPVPGAGEVLVETSFVGVNFADCAIRMGLYASAKEYVGWPITPGFELAGTVRAVGAGVDQAMIGRACMGVTRFGGYATHLTVPADQVFDVPAGLSLAEAAGFPTVHLTAWYALRELCRLRPGMRVLVHSAAGGVGCAAVQIAKLHGCYVVGVVGAAHKVETVAELGADAVIDKHAEPLWPAARRLAPRGYHVVLDANGVETLRESYRHLAPTGRLVIYGFHSMLSRTGRGRPQYLGLARDYVLTPRFDPFDMTNANKSVMAFNLSYLFDEKSVLAEAMGELATWRAEGKLAAPRVTIYAFDDVALAQRTLESGRTVGKLVLATAGAA